MYSYKMTQVGKIVIIWTIQLEAQKAISYLLGRVDMIKCPLGSMFMQGRYFLTSHLW